LLSKIDMGAIDKYTPSPLPHQSRPQLNLSKTK
jgi:hypothetical protein